jgi:hypothetical protein
LPLPLYRLLQGAVVKFPPLVKAARPCYTPVWQPGTEEWMPVFGSMDMTTKWTHTRDELLRIQPGEAGAYLTRLVFKGPQIVAQARTLLREHPLHDDRFKIRMIHYLRQTLPGGMDALYEAILKDIMADKPQLQASE